MWKAVKQGRFFEFSENAERGSCGEGRGCELWPARIQQAKPVAQAYCQGYLIIIKGYIMDDDGENVFLLIFTQNTKSWSCSGLWDQSINLQVYDVNKITGNVLYRPMINYINKKVFMWLIINIMLGKFKLYRSKIWNNSDCWEISSDAIFRRLSEQTKYSGGFQ